MIRELRQEIARLRENLSGVEGGAQGGASSVSTEQVRGGEGGGGGKRGTVCCISRVNTHTIIDLTLEYSVMLMCAPVDSSSFSSSHPVQVSRLEMMVSDLQLAKQETWEEKERLSEMYEEERRKNLAKKVGTALGDPC